MCFVIGNIIETIVISMNLVKAGLMEKIVIFKYLILMITSYLLMYYLLILDHYWILMLCFGFSLLPMLIENILNDDQFISDFSDDSLIIKIRAIAINNIRLFCARLGIRFISGSSFMFEPTFYMEVLSIGIYWLIACLLMFQSDFGARFFLPKLMRNTE